MFIALLEKNAPQNHQQTLNQNNCQKIPRFLKSKWCDNQCFLQN